MSKRKDNEIFPRCEQLLKGGADIENVIALLKREGYSQGVASAFLASIGIMSAGEAKSLVLESEVWSDNYTGTLEVHDSLSDEYVESLEHELNEESSR